MIKKLYISGLIGIILLFGGCQDDEQPRVDVFTLIVADGYFSDLVDNWVIISDSDGQLLDHQLLQTGTFNLQASQISSDSKLNISLLSRSTSNPNINFFSMTTYTGIDPGDSWTLQHPQSVKPNPVIGFADITINNLPPQGSVQVIASKIQEGWVSYTGNLTDKGNTTDLEMQMPISAMQRDVLISVSPQFFDQSIPTVLTSKHYLLGDLVPDQQIILDFNNDFIAFDQSFNLDVPGSTSSTFLSIYGFNELSTYGEGFIFTSSIASYPIDAIGGFFNTGFDYYETIFKAGTNNGSTEYRKVGDAATTSNLAPRDLDFQIQDNTFNNYTFNASPEFQIVETGWFNQMEIDGVFNSLSWTVYSDRRDTRFPVLTSFPSELAADNPVLNTEDLENTHSCFIHNIDNKAYKDFLDQTIRQPSAGKQLEEVYKLTKFN